MDGVVPVGDSVIGRNLNPILNEIEVDRRPRLLVQLSACGLGVVGVDDLINAVD